MPELSPRPNSTSDELAPTDAIATASSHTTLASRTAWCVMALVVWCVLWETLIAPTRPLSQGFPWLALKGLILLPLLTRLWRGERRAFQVLTLLILLYVTEACVRAYSDPSGLSRAAAWVELLLSGVIFVLANLYARRTRVTPTDAQLRTRKPRPKGMAQLMMYLYASLLVFTGMSYVYTPDGTESARFHQVVWLIRIGFVLFNLYLITRLIVQGRARAQAATNQATKEPSAP